MSWWERQFAKALQGDISIGGDLSVTGTITGSMAVGELTGGSDQQILVNQSGTWTPGNTINADLEIGDWSSDGTTGGILLESSGYVRTTNAGAGQAAHLEMRNTNSLVGAINTNVNDVEIVASLDDLRLIAASGDVDIPSSDLLVGDMDTGGSTQGAKVGQNGVIETSNNSAASFQHLVAYNSTGGVGTIESAASSFYVKATGGLLLLDSNSGSGTVKFNAKAEAGTFSTSGATAGQQLLANGIRRSSGTNTGTYQHNLFYNANGLVGQIRTNGTATQYITSSDYRLKKNIRPIEEPLSRLNSINIYEFEFKGDNDTAQGVLAHELQELIPQAVSGEKDGEEMQGVDYSVIVPLLVSAVQELSAKVRELEHR